jgi:hypothetical protein
MAVFLSPGVFPREIDLSVLPAQNSDIVPAFIGTASKGPINVPTFVSNAEQYIDLFGNPFPESNLGYAVLAYLEEGNLAWVLRVGVECEDGQPPELSCICIDASGARGRGWGRMPLFSGIDYGKICLRIPTADNPITFHTADVYGIEYSDIETSTTFGPTSATLVFTGTDLSDAYCGAIDDSFCILITKGPDVSSESTIDGAEYEIIRNSDGAVISSGTIIEGVTPGASLPIPIGSGDDDSCLIARIEVTGDSPIDVGDTFCFKARPDNRCFMVEVEGVPQTTGTDFCFNDGDTFDNANDFADALNALVGAGVDFKAVDIDPSDDCVTGGELLCLRTDTPGERIQITDTEAWALEVGVAKWAFDIPRSYLMGEDTGPYNITTSNNRVVTLAIGSESSVELECTVPVGIGLSPTVVAAALDLGGVKGGVRYYDSFALQVSDDDQKVVMVTSVSAMFDQLQMLADSSHIRTLRFSEELEIMYPYTRSYRPFDDPRVIMPPGGSVTPAMPLSCEIDPSSNECAVDTSYFQNIVGFFVATSPGTWVNNYKITLSNYNNLPGVYTIRIISLDGIEVDRIDDVYFDPSAARYVANLINPGSTIGGINGNAFINWEERPSYLGNDLSDPTTLETRYPGMFSNHLLTGGANGIPLDPTYSSELDRAIIGNAAESTGIFAFQNPEIYDITLLVIPGNSSGAVIGQGLQLCEGRGDCMMIVDPPFGLRPQQVVDWHNGMLLSDLTQAINSSYGALYWSWLEIYDQFNGGNIFIPPSGFIAGVIARTSRVAEMWFAPAGLNRGHLLTALDVEYSPTKGERDLLYGFNNAVNPIVNFPQDGITVWGQRTLQRKDSALDRVNVRMLLIYLKKILIRTLRFFLFEPNDRYLRSEVVNTIDPMLNDVMARRGLTGYKVVCDETNNTPIRIDRNELWVSVFLKPTRAAEFIVLNLVILRTEQSFSADEVLQAGGVVLTQ